MKTPKVSDKQLLHAFERLCAHFNVLSRGFSPKDITAPIDGEKYDGIPQWAMHHLKGFGWMIICGAGGCGAVFSRYNGYIKGRWNFLMAMEMLIWSHKA